MVMVARRIPRVPRASRISDFVAARTGGPAIDPAEVGEVLARYGLEPTGSGQNLRLGRRSRNVAVSCRTGPKVVKRYRPRWRPAAVRYGHSILVRLEELGFPAVRLVRTPEGATWTQLDDGLYAVFDLVRGTNYSLNYLRRRDRLELTRVAATTLARMHRTLEDFTPLGEHHLSFASPTGDRVRDVAWHAAKLEELRARSATLEDPEALACTARLTELADPVLEQITSLEPRLADAALPRLVIHGDFGLHNLIFPSPGRAVPIDFEVARLDWRVNDLVSALGKYRFRDGSYDLAAMERFIEGYAPAFPFTPDELALFPDVWRLYRLRAAVQYWNSYFETSGPVRKLRSALLAIDQAAWVADRPDGIGRLVRAAERTPS
jgi:Ser/Thr protein kinase RdoA (MazF antagonist)